MGNRAILTLVSFMPARRSRAGTGGLSGRPCCLGGATVLGTALKLLLRFAALANGTAMHADDYDDTLQAEMGRLRWVRYPMALVLSAVCWPRAKPGRVGPRGAAGVSGWRGSGLPPVRRHHVNHIPNGFHATATCGMLGAAAAVGRPYGMDADGHRHRRWARRQPGRRSR